MSRSVRSKVVFVLFALTVPAVALAQGQGQGGKAPTGDKYDPENVTAISQYMETLVKATDLVKAKDMTGAIDTYKKAIQLNPRHPLGYLLLTDAYILTGNLGEAEGTIAQGYEGDTKNALLRAQVLMVRADVFEREKKWDEAKAAWQEYTEQAVKSADAGAFPQNGAERVKALQKVVEQDKAYVAVRERIAAEKAAAADAGAKPVAKPKK